MPCASHLCASAAERCRAEGRGLHIVQVCYYRDKQTTNKFQIAKVTKDGASVSEPFAIQTKWDYRVTLFPHPALHAALVVSFAVLCRRCPLVLKSWTACCVQAFVDPAATAVGTW